MNNEVVNSQFIQIKGTKIHYLETGETDAPPILFLHGASFRAQTWQDLGSLQLVAEKGYRGVALDLPGYGESGVLSGSREEFLLQFIEALNLKLPIVISPSMSGGYSLPFLVNHPQKLRGFVPVAPVGISRYGEQLKGIEVPTLAIWGSNDRIVPVAQADFLVEVLVNSKKLVLQNAGHACYMRATAEFHQHLLDFIATC
ncbi:MAG: alpha/beta fold hydrolase [Spirulinaceae cyanobacterium]